MAGFGAGCGGDDEEESRAGREGTASGQTTERQKTAPARGREKRRERRGEAGRRRSGQQSAADRKRAERERREEEEFDRGFRETPFERLVGSLPVRRPPLFVEQYILTEGSHTVHTGVDPKRFFCGRTPAQRREAVEAFYRDADRALRRGGVRDFVLVVTPVAETPDELPALARGERGSVELTSRGEARGPC